MKQTRNNIRTISIITSASAASFMAFTSLAQEAPNATPLIRGTAAYSHQPATQEGRVERLGPTLKASDLIGMAVTNYQNEKLGKVDSLAVDMASGKIVQVILSTGGFLGLGDTLHAVPPSALRHDVATKSLHLDVDKAKLEAAPKFEASSWTGTWDTVRANEVNRYYAKDTAFGSTTRQDGLNTGDNTLGSTTRQDGSSAQDKTLGNTTRRDGSFARDTTLGSTTRRDVSKTESLRNPDGSQTDVRIITEQEHQAESSRPVTVQNASTIIGKSVVNLQDEALGKVENLMVDLPAGRVVAVIISSGGFLGIGDELSAIPTTALQFNSERDTLQLNASKEKLSSAPHFQASQWPDLGQPDYVSEVYRAYQVEPYFSTNGVTLPDANNMAGNVRDRDDRGLTPRDQRNSKADVATTPQNRRDLRGTDGTDRPDADNTARNARDRDDQALTPLDQGNSKADVATTAQIRKGILADKEMSTNAKNVKIITSEGQVTLRGPVNTAEEKRLIGEIANRIAGKANVDNQLEVRFSGAGIR